MAMQACQIHFRSKRAAERFQQQDRAVDLAIELACEFPRCRMDLSLDRTVSFDRIIVDQNATQGQHRYGDRQAVQDEPLGERWRRSRLHEKYDRP